MSNYKAMPDGYTAAFEAQQTVSYQNPLGGPRIDYPQPIIIKVYRDGDLIAEQPQNPDTPNEQMVAVAATIAYEHAQANQRFSYDATADAS